VHPTKFLKPHSALVFFVLKKGAGLRCRGGVVGVVVEESFHS